MFIVKRTVSRLCEVVHRVLRTHHAFCKMFTELFKITARLVNNLSDAPNAQDNLSIYLSCSPHSPPSADTLAKKVHKSKGCRR